MFCLFLYLCVVLCDMPTNRVVNSHDYKSHAIEYSANTDFDRNWLMHLNFECVNKWLTHSALCVDSNQLDSIESLLLIFCDRSWCTSAVAALFNCIAEICFFFFIIFSIESFFLSLEFELHRFASRFESIYSVKILENVHQLAKISILYYIHINETKRNMVAQSIAKKKCFFFVTTIEFCLILSRNSSVSFFYIA